MLPIPRRRPVFLAFGVSAASALFVAGVSGALYVSRPSTPSVDGPPAQKRAIVVLRSIPLPAGVTLSVHSPRDGTPDGLGDEVRGLLRMSCLGACPMPWTPAVMAMYRAPLSPAAVCGFHRSTLPDDVVPDQPPTGSACAFVGTHHGVAVRLAVYPDFETTSAKVVLGAAPAG